MTSILLLIRSQIIPPPRTVTRQGQWSRDFPSSTPFMVYETRARKSISQQSPGGPPTVQETLLQSIHRLLALLVQVVMPEQMEQSVDDIQTHLVVCLHLVPWRLAEGRLGGYDDLTIEVPFGDLLQWKSDDIGGRRIIHELLMKSCDRLIVDETESDPATMVVLCQDKANEVLDLIVVKIDELLEILDLHLDLSWRIGAHVRRAATVESGADPEESSGETPGVSSSVGYLTLP